MNDFLNFLFKKPYWLIFLNFFFIYTVVSYLFEFFFFKYSEVTDFFFRKVSISNFFSKASSDLIFGFISKKSVMTVFYSKVTDFFEFFFRKVSIDWFFNFFIKSQSWLIFYFFFQIVSSDWFFWIILKKTFLVFFKRISSFTFTVGYLFTLLSYWCSC